MKTQESTMDYSFIHEQPYPRVAHGTKVALEVPTLLKKPTVNFKHTSRCAGVCWFYEL